MQHFITDSAIRSTKQYDTSQKWCCAFQICGQKGNVFHVFTLVQRWYAIIAVSIWDVTKKLILEVFRRALLTAVDYRIEPTEEVNTKGRFVAAQSLLISCVRLRCISLHQMTNGYQKAGVCFEKILKVQRMKWSANLMVGIERPRLSFGSRKELNKNEVYIKQRKAVSDGGAPQMWKYINSIMKRFWTGKHKYAIGTHEIASSWCLYM